MRREFKVEINQGNPQVAYKEAFSVTIEHREVLKKQSGGRGKFADISFDIGPADKEWMTENPGKHFQFKNDIFGGPSVDVDDIQIFIGGDDLYLPIAAASIISKEYHDRYVCSWAEANPRVAEKYGLLTNKGYGTATHRSAIETFGPLEEHRRRFLKGVAFTEEES
jgi:translation elongation factor EF-G